MGLGKQVKSGVASFLRDTSGAATIETVIWVPVFALLLGLIADTALIFGGQSRIMRVVQDANRAMSIGRLTTPLLVQQQIYNQISSFTTNASVTTTVVSGVITSTVVVPVADLTATGLVAAFDGVTMSVTAQHMSEN